MRNRHTLTGTRKLALGMAPFFFLSLFPTGCKRESSASSAQKSNPSVPASVVYTVAGNGAQDPFQAGLSLEKTPIHAPSGLAVGPDGAIYFSQMNAIRKVTPSGTLVTVAGSDTPGFAGDGGPATQARFRGLSHLAFGPHGDLYVADHGNHCIRKIDAKGRVSTVAGVPSKNAAAKGGFSGDGGPATHAKLNGPNGIALDTMGNLYISDSINERIRKVALNGIISTVTGNGTLDAQGRGTFSGDGGPALKAGLNHPEGIAVDKAGNLYIADTQNSRVRKVSTSGIITTLAGTGKFGFYGDGSPAIHSVLNEPCAIIVAPSGNLYILDRANHVVRCLTPDGQISTVAGKISPVGSKCCGEGFPVKEGEAASVADFFFPSDIAADKRGNLYIADMKNNRVRKITNVLK